MRQLLIALALGMSWPVPAAVASGDLLSGRWVDDRGHVLTGDEMGDSMLVVTMAYGACRRVCSTALRAMKEVQALADRRRRHLQFVVVALDPAQDTPADWAAFRRDNNLQRSNWHFLSGDPASTSRLAARMGLRYWRYGDHILHDYRIVLVAPGAGVLRSLDSPDQGAATLLD